MLRIATEAARPPFASLDSQGHPVGFEIDLANALCTRLNLTCVFVRREWDRLWGTMMSGRADAVMSTLAITPERRGRYAFTRAYYREPVAFVARKGSKLVSLTPVALKGLRIGAERNTPAASLIEETFPESELRLFGSQREAALDLSAGRIDLAIGDRVAFADWIAREPEAACCKIAGPAPASPEILGEGFAIGVRPDRAELAARIDAALAQMMADGSYAAIATRHFGFDPR